MIVEYRVKDSDTIQSIAMDYLKDPAKWVDIVDYNKLDYPFITEDMDFATKIAASGTVRFYLTPLSGSSTIIPEGTIVSASGSDRTYAVLETAIIPAGANFVDVEVACTFTGIWGNVAVGEIDTVSLTPPVPGLTVSNLTAFANGMEYNVIKTGESLYIPIDEEIQEGSLETALTYLDTMGGEDIIVDEYGDLTVDSYGDIGSVTGVLNVAYGLLHRFNTEKEELLHHPEYGSNFHLLIGKTAPFINKLIELEVIGTALSERRIASAELLYINRRGDRTDIGINATIEGQQGQELMRFSLA